VEITRRLRSGDGSRAKREPANAGRTFCREGVH